MTNEWKPHKKQAEFLALPTTLREAMYGGGAGSAKTETLLMYGIIHRWHEHPRFKQVIMRRTMPELRNEVLPRAKFYYKKFGADFNGQTMAFTFPSGAMVFLAHCEHEDDVHKYDSMEINLYTPDELTSFTEWQYLYIAFERVRSSSKDLPAIVRAAGMPGGVGHSWVKKRFVDPAPKGSKVIVGRGGNKRIYIHATLADNPYVDQNYSQSLDALPEAEKQAKKYGSWDAYLGQVFEEFRDKKYVDEPENALHVIAPFVIPEWWPRILVGDWGFTAMTWFGWGAISPDKRLYLYREQSWKKVLIEEWAPYVKEFVDTENPRIIKLCKSAGQNRGQEHTIQQQISSALGRAVQLTDNSAGSRISGKMLIHEYLRFKSLHIPNKIILPYNEEHAQWLLRNRPQSEYNAYMLSYNEKKINEDNLPKLQIFNTCPIVINALKACVYAKPINGVPADDIAEFDGDDPVDGTRYLVSAADMFFDDSSREFETIQKREVLTQQLEQTGDMTSFYRNARKLESNNGITAVRRYNVH